MLTWNGNLDVSKHNNIVNPTYCVYRFRQNIEPWFYHHLFQTPTYKNRIKTMSTKIVENRLRLYTNNLKKIESLLPPTNKQQTIVQFVQTSDKQINRLIQTKQQLIELLNEQKRAIIHRTVTHGPNPN